MLTTVIFDVTNSIMPNKCGLFLRRLQASNPSAYDEMLLIVKEHYYGSRSKEYLKQSFSIKLGLSKTEANELDVTPDRVEKFFGPTVRLLQKKSVSVMFVGNAGHEDVEVYSEFCRQNGLQPGVYSSTSGLIFGLDDILSNQQIVALSQFGTALFISADPDICKQFKELRTHVHQYSDFRSLVNALFEPS